MAMQETQYWVNAAVPDHPDQLGITYVAGPMTGYAEWNYPAFINMATRLRKAGYRVISPHELHEPSAEVAWDWFLRRDLRELVKCSRIVMLSGWHRSKGARLEHHVAKSLGMEIVYPSEHGTLFVGSFAYQECFA